MLLLLCEKLLVSDQELRLDVGENCVKPDLHLTGRGNDTTQMGLRPVFLMFCLWGCSNRIIHIGGKCAGVVLRCSDVISHGGPITNPKPCSQDFH